MNIARGIARAGFNATVYVFRNAARGYVYAHVSANTIYSLRGAFDVVDYTTTPRTEFTERVEDESMRDAAWSITRD